MSTSSTTQYASRSSAGVASAAGTGTHRQTDTAPATGVIVYEQPLNERTRIFMRLEYLFRQAGYHLEGTSEWDSRATLNCILEIVDIFSNTNLKSEVIKELERHSANLKRLGENPAVDPDQLGLLLGRINTHIDSMHGINGQIASELKCSEFLTSIRQRNAIPGGTCDFDLPAFHYWLQQPAGIRNQDLCRWLGNFDAIGQAIRMILSMTRDSTPLKRAVAKHGLYQRTLDPNLPCQLIRIALPAGLPCFAELSGGRHRFTARFLHFSAAEERARQTDQDIEFELACCVI
ncbi:MAG: cell division protein ZapD [Gammaproteobacteria bacterium]|jgi:cell division protein ZapD